MINKKEFGAFVAQLRKEKGYTQKEMAEQLFVSDKAVSKWETAVSLPDTALLIPLADLLGVSVTELLMCKRLEEQHSIAPDEVESVVKTAIGCSTQKPIRSYQVKNRWTSIYLLCTVLCGIVIFLNHQFQALNQGLITPCVLEVVFGAYFCLFARIRLPDYYDENKICQLSDGFFRMNMPGLSFNNGNWPYILKVCRIQTCFMMLFCPLFNLLMHFAEVEWWNIGGIILLSALVLLSLFLPIYIVGKKYEQQRDPTTMI